MNALFGAVGADAAARVALGCSVLSDTHQTAPGDGALGWARTGDHLLGSAGDGALTLTFLGTLFAGNEGWSDPGNPIEHPDRAAAWLVERYKARGDTFLEGVIGQFAVVLHDASAARWLIAADPFGGRNFMVAESAGGLAFSTKLDVLAAMQGPALELDREYEDFFLLHGFYPFGRTPFTGIRAMGAGELLVVAGGTVERREIAGPSWPVDPAASAQGVSSEDDAVAELERIFLASLADMLPTSRETVAVLLGGFDSALVAAGIKRLGYPVVTYSFRYADASYNQPHTDTLARHLGIEHRWIDIDRAMIEQGLADFAHLFNQPTNWPNYVIQTLRVVERIKADGIDFCYSGDGCDAAFLGYPGTYARAKLTGMLPRLPRPLHRAALGMAASRFAERRLGHPWRVALGLLRGMGRSAVARDFLSFRIMDEVSLAQLRPGQPVADVTPLIERLSAPHAALPGVRRAYLGKAAVSPNRSKMIASADVTGVPILAPYLHPALKRFALALPLEMLRPAHGGPATGKHVLNRMAEVSGLLPREVIHQPKMAAVDAPVDEWYAGPMRGRMMEIYADLPFAANRKYLSRLLDLKAAEGLFKRRIMTDKVISHAASLLATYARFARLAKN